MWADKKNSAAAEQHDQEMSTKVLNLLQRMGTAALMLIKEEWLNRGYTVAGRIYDQELSDRMMRRRISEWREVDAFVTVDEDCWNLVSRYQQCLRNSVLPRTRAEMLEVENILEAKKRQNEKEEELVIDNENIRTQVYILHA